METNNFSSELCFLELGKYADKDEINNDNPHRNSNLAAFHYAVKMKLIKSVKADGE